MILDHDSHNSKCTKKPSLAIIRVSREKGIHVFARFRRSQLCEFAKPEIHSIWQCDSLPGAPMKPIVNIQIRKFKMLAQLVNAVKWLYCPSSGIRDSDEIISGSQVGDIHLVVRTPYFFL